MTKARITEIFKSIQGEGQYSGVQQIFVRLWGCNLNCLWCDTKQSRESDPSGQLSYREQTVDQVFMQILKLWEDCHSISITGGEPLLQSEFLAELLARTAKLGMKSYLETNGTLWENLMHVIRYLDIIAMDIKLPSSTGCKYFWVQHKKFLEIAKGKDVFIKAVISNKTSKQDVLRAVRLIEEVDAGIKFILQPNYYDLSDGVMERCEEFKLLCQKNLKDVEVMPQMHKLMGIR